MASLDQSPDPLLSTGCITSPGGGLPDHPVGNMVHVHCLLLTVGAHAQFRGQYRQTTTLSLVLAGDVINTPSAEMWAWA